MLGSFWEDVTLLPMFGPFKLPTTNGHLGPPLRTNGKAPQKIETFWWTHCLPGGMAKAIPYKHLAPPYCMAFSSKYRTLSRYFAVGADPCVRPAGTRAGFLSLRRMRTTPIYRKMDPFGNIFPLFPTFGRFKLPTVGGHLGPPLRTGGLVILFILLQYFYKYKGQTCENFLHTPTKWKHPHGRIHGGVSYRKEQL